MKPKLFGAAVLLLACSAIATADCGLRRVAVRRNVAVVAPVVATFVPLVVPAYSVTYSDQGAALAAELQQLRAEIRQQGSRVGVRMPPASEASASADSDGLVVLQTRCASCHEKAVAKVKGKGLVLLEGKEPADIDGDTALDVCLAVLKDEMPPGKPLSAAEKKALAGLFDSKK